MKTKGYFRNEIAFFVEKRSVEGILAAKN